MSGRDAWRTLDVWPNLVKNPITLPLLIVFLLANRRIIEGVRAFHAH
jgi:hypothetical protein